MRQQDVERAVTRLSPGGAVVAVLGPPGIGRSWTLGEVAGRLHGRGFAVRSLTGHPAEADVPFAGLQQLVHRDLQTVAAALSPGRRRALLAALGDEAMADPLPLGAAVLDVLRVLAGGQPLLVVADDAHRLDVPSRRALAFAARRLAKEPVSLLVASTGAEPPEEFAGVAQRLLLAPLGPAESGGLLDGLPAVPTGPFRAAVLAGAEGNPLALRELAAGPPGAAPLAPTPALSALAGPGLEGVPASVRAAVAVLAVAEPEDLHLAGHGFGFAPPVWAEAARLGLVRTWPVRFPHPLRRARVLHDLALHERQQAHRHLASLPAAVPRRAAWHRAAGATGPDDAAADALAGEARDPSEWERAAALSSDPGVGLDRLLTALRMATAAGQVAVGRRLLGEVRRGHGERTSLDVAAATLDAWSGRADPATLLGLVDHDPPAVVAAAVPLAYHSGDPGLRRRVRAAAVRLPPGAEALAWWTDVGTGASVGEQARVHLHAFARTTVAPELAAAAWLLDEPLLASRLLDRRPDAAESGLWPWTQLELGRWDEAGPAFGRTLERARAWQQPRAEGMARAGLAYLAAARGDRAEADAQAVSAVRATASPAVAVRAHHAQGLAALVAGDGAAAWAHLSRSVGPSGDAAHFHAAAYAVVDLAEAAVRVGRPERGADLVGALLDGPGAPASARVRQLEGHALALLAAEGSAPDDARHWFGAALRETEGERWPFERARLLLAHGRWLRRGRRVAQAREPLELAAVVFARLGAEPWVRATRQELRAAGVQGGEPPRLADLTATEWEIVRLAADGLSNPEIAARLVLSPRTVASHLYRSFPKLGVTARRQLRDLVPSEVQSADG